PCDGRGRLSPHRGWKGTILPENSTLGRRFGAEPVLPLGLTPRPSQGGHDDYQSAAFDRAGITFFRDITFLAAGPARERRRSAKQRTTGMSKAVPGCLLVVASWVIAFLTLVLIEPGERLSWWQNAGLIIGLSIAGMCYTAGVISWAIYGAVASDLENIQKQNKEMIDLLRRIADGGRGPGAPPPPGGPPPSPPEVTIPAVPPSPPGITGP